MNHSSIVRIGAGRRQDGIVLIETMIGIVIFAIGILGLMALQAASIKESTDAKYRTDASLLVDQLVGKMWVSDRDTVKLATAFSSNPAGPEYLKWVGATNQLGSVLKTMPQKTGTGGTPKPSVVITAVDGGAAGAAKSSLVKITLYWQAPYETTQHQYSVVTQIR